MIEQDTIRLLRECDAGIKMGVASIDKVRDYVKSADLRNALTECKSRHEKLKDELEQALDDIIRDYGGGVFSPGVFLQDDVDPTRYHKLVIVTDDETGHKDLGIDQEGVIK